MKKLITLSIAALTIVVSIFLFAFSTTSKSDTSEYTEIAPLEEKMQFNAKGELIRPSPDVYTSWIFVGANVTPGELNTGPRTVLFPGFHNTLMPPSDFEHFKKTGEFREGTQFIQFNVYAGKRGASGSGYFEEEIHSLKASVKDKKRFPNHPGGWGYFKWQENHADKNPVDASPVETVAKCNQCHVNKAIETDYVFMQHYPVLRLYDPKN